VRRLTIPNPNANPSPNPDATSADPHIRFLPEHAGLTKTCRDAVTRRDAVTVNDPAGDALSGPIVCYLAAAPGHQAY